MGDAMNKSKLAALVAGAALAVAAAACTDNATNTNTNANSNTNRATVLNNNGNANTSGITTTNTNNANTAHSGRNYNMTREEYEKDDKSYRGEAERAGDKIGAAISDGWLHLKVRGALAAAEDLRDSTINVDVDNAVVTLRGTVGDQKQVTAADKAAKGVEGVKSVKNMLKVSAGGGNTNGGNTNGGNTNSNRH